MGEARFWPNYHSCLSRSVLFQHIEATEELVRGSVSAYVNNDTNSFLRGCEVNVTC